MYNYYENVKSDILEVLPEYKEYSDIEWNEENKNEIFEEVYDKLWTDDSVTGNGSGSYFFNIYKSEEAISHNMELLAEALSEFGCDLSYITEKGVEACDVTIRCYLLSELLDKALDEFLEDV